MSDGPVGRFIKEAIHTYLPEFEGKPKDSTPGWVKKAVDKQVNQNRDPTEKANGLPPLPPDKPRDPFNMPLANNIITEYPQLGMHSEDVNSAGFHLTLPAFDVGKQQSEQDLVNSLYNMSPDDLKKLQQEMVDANYLNPQYVSGFADKATVNAYELLLEDVRSYQSNPANVGAGKQMTIEDLLKQRAEGYKAGKGQSVTKTQINLFSPLQAQSFLEGAAEKYLGRRPNQAELTGFLSSLNAYQQANPDTITQTTDQQGNVTSEADKTGITALHGGDQSAENYIMQTNPAEVKGYAGDNALMAIMSHLGLPQ